MQAAAEVDQALGAVDERGEQYGATTLTGKTSWPEKTPALWITASIRPSPIHLVGDAARLLEVGQVSGDRGGPAVQQISDRREPLLVTSVDDDVMAMLEQRPCGIPSEPIRRTGDETRAIGSPNLSPEL
jgi:hypothetical protein